MPTPHSVQDVIRASSLSAGCLLCVGVTEAVIRSDQPFDGTSFSAVGIAALGTAIFFAVLLVQVVRPGSRPLTIYVAVVAAAAYVVFPAMLLFARTGPDASSVDLFAITAILSFTYSARGWAALAAAGAFVLLMSRSQPTPPRPSKTAHHPRS